MKAYPRGKPLVLYVRVQTCFGGHRPVPTGGAGSQIGARSFHCDLERLFSLVCSSRIDSAAKGTKSMSKGRLCNTRPVILEVSNQGLRNRNIESTHGPISCQLVVRSVWTPQ